MNTDENRNEESININYNNLEEDMTHLVDLTKMFEEEELSTEGMRPTKRVREKEDEWNLVKRRKERLREVRGITELCITSKSIFPKQFALAKLFKEQKIMNVTRVKYVNPYKINVEINNTESAENLVTCVYFKELGWKFHRPFEVSLSYGVIKNIELDISEEELLKNMTSNINIVNVRRLKRRDKEGSGWTESETWRVGFEGSSLPSYVFFHDMRVVVEPFVFQVTQCSKCWRYGRSKKMCPSKLPICPKCGGKHENCQANTFRCVNCNMNHMSLDKTCPVYIREKKLRDIMSEFNVSYRKALDMYVPPTSLCPTLQENVMPNITRIIPIDAASTSPILPAKHTYAQATVHSKGAQAASTVESDKKISTERPKQKETNPKRKEIQEVMTDSEELSTNMNNIIDTSEDTCREEVSDNSCKDNIRHPRDYSLRWLIDKFKYILFIKKDNVKSKIISMVQIGIEWVVSWIVSNIPDDFSFLSKMFNNG